MVLSIIWLSLLCKTDSIFSIYALLAFGSFYLRLRQNVQKQVRKDRYGRTVLAAVLSFLVILANYPLFTTIGDPALIGRSTSLAVNCVNSVLCFLGGICTFYPLIDFLFSNYPEKCICIPKKKCRKWLPAALFAVLFCLNMVHLFLVEYPGNLTEDTFGQMEEMISGTYSNFNTFWHTMIFQFWLRVGYAVFGDVNAAAAVFCVFQAAVMCFAFVHCLMTMYRFGIPKKWLILTFALYAFIPYNLAMPITVWKDVLYAGSCLLILSALLRIFRLEEGSCLWDWMVFLLGSILFILSRSNGWIVYLVSFLVWLVLIRKNTRLLWTMGVVALSGWLLLNPVLGALNVEDSDLVESLSIPVQQISRVIADGCELTKEEQTLLEKVIDLEEVPLLYTNWLSDPMKVEFRSKDYEFLQQNLPEYANLWLRLGIRYPAEYLKAWIDQTKGYWNGGYDYHLYSETITENPYGVEKSGGVPIVAALFSLYFGLSRHVVFFEPFHSIGLHIWFLLLCFLLNLRRKREEWFLSVPLLIMVVGLWIGTPVYCCFRYVYPIFVSMPLIVSTALYTNK